MKADRIFLFFLEAGLVVAWSSGFVGAKLASDTAPIFLVMFWRFAAVSVLSLPFIVAYRCRAGSHSLFFKSALVNVIIGAFAMFGFLAMAVKSVDLGVPPGLVALVAALQPLTTAALAGPVLAERVSPRQWLGLVIGFAGVAIAVGATPGAAPLWAYFLPLGAMGSLVAGTLYAKSRTNETPLAASIGIQSTVAALLFLPLALVEGGGIAPIANADFLAAVGWFIAFSTIGAYGFYWACLHRTTVVRVGSLIYLTPPVTMLWAWVMFHEPLHIGGIAGFAVCLLGVLLSRDYRAAQATC